MEFDPSRLRRGEVIAGASAVVLLALMLVVPWYGLDGAAERTAAALGRPTTFTGWQGLTDVRWLLLLAIAAALCLVYLQTTRRAPALPVTLSVIVTVLAAASTVALLYRVLINPPGDSFLSVKVGAFPGLISVLAMFWGGFASMRQEGLVAGDARTDMPTIRVGGGQPPAGESANPSAAVRRP